MIYHSIHGFDVHCKDVEEVILLSKAERGGFPSYHPEQPDPIDEIRKSVDNIYQEMKKNNMTDQQFEAVLSSLPDYKLADGTTLPHLAKCLYLLFKKGE